MTSVIDKALKKRKELQNELERLNAFIDLYQEFSDDVGDLFQDTDSPSGAQEKEKPQRRRGNPAAVADAAEKVIRELNRPVQRGELVDRIELSGLEIHSDDKPRYIGTILWRDSERFINIEGMGYWLTDLPYPEGGPFE